MLGPHLYSNTIWEHPLGEGLRLKDDPDLKRSLVRQWLLVPPWVNLGRRDYWAVTCDFQQCGVLTWIHSDEPVQTPFKLSNTKCCLISSLTVIEYSSDQQRLWSVCAYAQADLRLCWSQIPHCWKSHVAAQLWFLNSKIFAGGIFGYIVEDS